MTAILLFIIGMALFLGGGALAMTGLGLVPPLTFDWVGFGLGICIMVAGCLLIESAGETEDQP